MNLSSHSLEWKVLYEEEAKRIKSAIGNFILEMQHIGSTAIPGIKAKPIIDIAVMLSSLDKAEKLIKPLAGLGYNYDKLASSSERYFFRKGEPAQYHLSLTAPNVTFWQRQILFRDYLISHPLLAKEYEKLKLEMTKKDPTGRNDYLKVKSLFIRKILELAERD
ncbi:MAG: GrpB family protein [Candidatus Jorgensenbacteria bacterium]